MEDLAPDTYYYDGGVIRPIDIATALNWCMEEVDGDMSKITIDILMNDGIAFEEVDASDYRTFDVA